MRDMVTKTSYAAGSDFHGFLPDTIPDVKFLFMVGDIWPAYNHTLAFQYMWAEDHLDAWISRALGHVDHVIGVCGNHDFIGQEAEGVEILNLLPWTYLCDETVAIEGIKIHGSPWTPTFFDWAFMRPDWELMPFWNQIPSNGLDVLLTHGPAKGVCDRTVGGEHVGSESLSARLEQIESPQAHFVGHIHHARGTHGGFLGTPLTANVAYVNERYQPDGAWFTGELDKS